MTELSAARFVVGRDGLVQESNAAAQELARGTRLVGASFVELVAATDRRVLENALERALRGELVALVVELDAERGPAAVTLEPWAGGARALVLPLAPARGLGPREVDALAQGISHDLGAHARALESFATFLREDAGASLSDVALADLARLEGAVARLRAGLSGVVDYLRAPESGGSSSLRDAALEAVRALALERAKRVAVEGGDARVAVSTEKLAALVSRLVENALEHGGPRARVAITVAAGAARACLSVADDGPGLAPGERARAREVFARLRPRAPGSTHAGLGLATVARAVLAWGGSLELGASESGGLEVRVELPRADSTCQKAA